MALVAGATLAAGAHASYGAGTLEVCKSSLNGMAGRPFQYAISQGPASSTTITVRGGRCSGPMIVPHGAVTVTELPTDPATDVSAIQVRPSSRLLSDERASRRATVVVVAGSTAANETRLTFTNEPGGGTHGDLKICKLTETFGYLGRQFSFRVNGGPAFSTEASSAFDSPSAWSCRLAGSFPVGSRVSVEELVPAGTHVAWIDSEPADRLLHFDTEAGLARVEVGSGATAVLFDDEPVPPRGTGWLEVCKDRAAVGYHGEPDPDVQGAFEFTVDEPDGSSFDLTVWAGQCSEPRLVAAGVVRVTEHARTGFEVVETLTIPADRWLADNLVNRSVDVEVPVSDNPADETQVHIVNRAQRGQLKICKALGPGSSALVGKDFWFDLAEVPGTNAGRVYDPVKITSGTTTQCRIVGEFPLGSQIRVTERNPGPYVDVAATNNPVTIARGINTVTVTNTAVGLLEICKARVQFPPPPPPRDLQQIVPVPPPTQPTFTFRVDGGLPFTLQAGKCTPPRRVPVGDHTIMELPDVTYELDPAAPGGGIDVVPPERTVLKNLALKTVVVSVPYAELGETRVDFYNRIKRGAVKICKDITPGSLDTLGLTDFHFIVRTSAGDTWRVGPIRNGECILAALNLPLLDHMGNPLRVTVTEDLTTASWRVTAITCQGCRAPVMTDLPNGEVVFSLGPFTNTVHFTNMKDDRPALKSGVKWHDLNANGVRDQGDVGLPGWTINAYRDLDSNGDLSQGEVDAGVAATDTTDAAGAYMLVLLPGRYIVCEVLQPGWTQSFPPAGPPTECDGTTAPLGPEGYAIALKAGQVDDGNDFGNWTPATKSGVKWEDLNGDSRRGDGEDGLPNWTINAYADTTPQNGLLDLAEFLAGPVATDTTDATGAYSLTLNPGNYIVCEVLKPGWTQTFPTGAPAECAAGAPTLAPEGWAITLVSGQQDTDNDFGNQLACKWCTKGAVLSQVVQNLGECCRVPDILVDVRLPLTDPILPGELFTNQPATGSIQKAIDYVNSPAWLLPPAMGGDPTPGDGEIFIAVTASDCGTGTVVGGDCDGQTGRGPNGAGRENIVLQNTRTDRFNLFGCSIDIFAANAAAPVVTIADSVGKVTVLDIHARGSSTAGYHIRNNADLVVVKNSRSIGLGAGTGIGYRIDDTLVEITGSPETSGWATGMVLNGSSITLRTNNDIRDNGIGINVIGNSNELNDNEVGESGHPNGLGIVVSGRDNWLHGDDVSFNTGHGITISGSGTVRATAAFNANEGNFLNDEDAHENGGDGINVSGNFNTLDANRNVDLNGGDGIEVSGTSNLLDGNLAEENTAHGFFISGNGNELLQNEANENGGDGFRISGDNNRLEENVAEDNTGNGIKADSADGASGNTLTDNQGDSNTLQGIRACGQTDAGGNTGSGNAVNPQVQFLCVLAAFYVADEGSDSVFGYDASWNLLGSFELHDDNQAPTGVAVAGSDIYVLDQSDDMVYRYDATSTLFEAVSRDLEQASPAGNDLGNPSGLALDGDHLWIADDGNTELLRFSLASAFTGSGSLNALAEVDLTISGNGSVEGLALDANCLYVLDDSDDIFYRYDRPEIGTACTAATGRVMQTTSGGSIGSAMGATVVGTALYLVDPGTDRAYQYTTTGPYTGSGPLSATAQFDLASANDDSSGLG